MADLAFPFNDFVCCSNMCGGKLGFGKPSGRGSVSIDPFTSASRICGGTFGLGNLTNSCGSTYTAGIQVSRSERMLRDECRNSRKQTLVLTSNDCAYQFLTFLILGISLSPSGNSSRSFTRWASLIGSSSKCNEAVSRGNMTVSKLSLPRPGSLRFPGLTGVTIAQTDQLGTRRLAGGFPEMDTGL